MHDHTPLEKSSGRVDTLVNVGCVSGRYAAELSSDCERRQVVVDDCGIVIAYINHESLDVLDSGSLPPERQFSVVDHRDTPHADRLSNLRRSHSSSFLL